MKHRRVRQGFNLLSPVYDQAVQLFFGARLHQAQTRFFNQLFGTPCIMVFGGGNGQILHDILHHVPEARVYFVDLSEKMVQGAAQNVKALEQQQNRSYQVTFICGSEQDLDPLPGADVLITPFVLDCFTTESLHPVMQQLDAKLKPGGRWFFSDFHRSENSSWGRSLVQLLYLGFNVVCGLGVGRLPNFEKGFEQLRYQLQKRWISNDGLLQSMVFQKETKNTSAPKTNNH